MRNERAERLSLANRRAHHVGTNSILAGTLFTGEHGTKNMLDLLLAQAIRFRRFISTSFEEEAVALRDKMLNSSAPYLEPGETAEAVFGAQTVSQYLFLLTGGVIFLAMNRYRIVVVTPKRIVVLDAGKLGMGKARGIVAELPRETQLGPASGVWHVIPVNGEQLHVHRRFFKDIRTADAAITAAA